MSEKMEKCDTSTYRVTQRRKKNISWRARGLNIEGVSVPDLNIRINDIVKAEAMLVHSNMNESDLWRIFYVINISFLRQLSQSYTIDLPSQMQIDRFLKICFRALLEKNGHLRSFDPEDIFPMTMSVIRKRLH